MEALTRLVADSLARHGLDRPVDPRRLQWSRWFRCDSTHSLLTVPSKPGIFALAEEVMDLGASSAHGGADALFRTSEQGSTVASSPASSAASTSQEGRGFTHGDSFVRKSPALSAEGIAESAQTTDVVRRMLAVLQFSEDDDMAFVLDRMFTRINPMRQRLTSGTCFLRFVVIEDQDQRRSICAALNQWMRNSAEKATGIPANFSSTLEVPRIGADAFVRPAENAAKSVPISPLKSSISSTMNSGSAKNLHCPHPLPSGF